MELKNAITNISHDIRTPITTISSYLYLLELFHYSVITSPERDMKTQPVWVNRVLEESILDFYAALQEKNITPNINITKKKINRAWFVHSKNID